MRIRNFKIFNLILSLSVFLIPFYIFRFNLVGVPTNIFEISVLILLIATISRIYRDREAVYSSSSSSTEVDQRLSPKLQNRNQTQITNTPKWIFVFCSVFLISCVISLWQSGFSIDSFGIVKGWVVVPMFFGAAIIFINKVNRYKYKNLDLTPIFWGLYSSLLLVSLWAIAQKFGIISTLFYQTGDTSFSQYLGENFRAFGPFESPNYLAMFIFPILFISIGTKSFSKNQKSKVWNYLFYLSLFLPLYALVISRSRAGVIALVGSLALFGVIKVYLRLKSRINRILLVALFIILCLLFLIIIQKIGIRPSSDAVRFEIYHYAWILLKENWLLGIGIGDFKSHLSNMPINPSFREMGLPYALHPHNLYLAMWLNFGLLGVISFFTVTICAIINVVKTKKNLLFILALTAILIHGIFDTTYFKNDLSAIYWLLIALAVMKEPTVKGDL